MGRDAWQRRRIQKVGREILSSKSVLLFRKIIWPKLVEKKIKMQFISEFENLLPCDIPPDLHAGGFQAGRDVVGGRVAGSSRPRATPFARAGTSLVELRAAALRRRRGFGATLRLASLPAPGSPTCPRWAPRVLFGAAHDSSDVSCDRGPWRCLRDGFGTR